MYARNANMLTLSVFNSDRKTKTFLYAYQNGQKRMKTVYFNLKSRSVHNGSVTFQIKFVKLFLTCIQLLFYENKNKIIFYFPVVGPDKAYP